MNESEITESAKAVAEVAKATGKVVDAGVGLGAFCSRVFGDPLEDAVGIASDRIRYWRISRASELQKKVEQILEDAGVEQTRPVSPVIGIPILEFATIEEDESLHTVWAKLLANAMNPSKSEVKRSFVGILSQLESFDVRLFALLMNACASQNYRRDTSFLQCDIEETLKNGSLLRMQINESGGFGQCVELDNSEVDHSWIVEVTAIEDIPFVAEVSLNNLIRTGLLTYNAMGDFVLRHDGRLPSTFRGVEEVSVTALGIEFFEAVKA